MYQLAEVRGEIGLVPASHIIAGEHVNAMKEFLKEKPEKTDKQVKTKLNNLQKN